MKNFDEVNIIPPLHRSTISFIGMLPRDRYIAVKKVRNNFFALDKNNRITTWNALTGKIKYQKEIASSQDYSRYQIFGYENHLGRDFTYSKEWY
jgi:folate-dependent tRNA-U54 methylase TrmFO/GidA